VSAVRIASLLPSATELLFAIGAGDDVVGVTHECDHPAAARRLPVLTGNLLDHVGQPSADVDRHIRAALHQGSGLYALDEERLFGLRPDLIVTQELCTVCAVAYTEVDRAARRLGADVPVLSLEPRSLDDICATALALGRATGHGGGADALVSAMRGRIAAVEGRRPPGPRSGVVCIEWTDPIMAGGHWVPEMVRRAGGNDLCGHQGEPSHTITWEEVVVAAPDVMVLMPCGHGLERTLELATEVTERPGFARLPCASTGRVAAVDGSAYFNRPGPRIVDGLEILAAILRSEPPARLPDGAAWVPC
jgi:iron complex transport system substrate-binding protein